MEPLSIIGGIAAVSQLIVLGKDFAVVLHKFFRNSGDTIDEVERFASQVDSFTQIVGIAEVSLAIHCREHQNDSAVLHFMQDRGLLAAISGESKIVTKRLREARDKIRDIDRGVNFRRGFNWNPQGLYPEAVD